jgi:hypothetical protein
MLLVKTDKGREALQSRDPSLSPRERQIIVLANGKLSREALGQLMQHDIRVDVERLVQCGFLSRAAASASIAATGPKQSMVATALNAALQIGARPVVQVVEASGPARQSSGSRRSLAGTKMYIMDMLQLMRNMEASSMAVTVHTSQGEMDFMYNVIVAARFIANNSGTSYGMRVVGKLREIVPQAHLDSVDALALELEASAVPA